MNANWLDEEDNDERAIRKSILEAADTIKILSEKLHTSQMERSSQYYNGGWIPCDEKTPEYDKEILLQTKYFGAVVGIYSRVDVWGEYKDVYLVHYSIVTDEMASVEVTHWAPLPESYKPREDEL
jgi:hypothetical protein